MTTAHICFNCSKPAAHQCTKCHAAWYCSTDCQKFDWVFHRMELCRTADELRVPDRVPPDLVIHTRLSHDAVLICDRSNHCIVTALYNKDYCYKSKNLRAVAGSLGLGANTPFFEYGSPDYTTISQYLRPALAADLIDVLRKKGKSGMLSGSDFHLWLEDGDGNVYDVVDSVWLHIAMFRRLRVHARTKQIIKNQSKQSLKELGLHYIPAPENIQSELVSAIVWRYKHKLGLLDFLL